MELLRERIIKEGRILPGNIIKVDSFLNHQMDPRFIREIGKEFSNRFKDKNITKVITIEASGIAVAIMVGLELGVPVVFAKKQKAGNMGDSIYYSTVKSYTKGTEWNIAVSKDYLNENDRVVIIDDFLAMGQAALGLVDIIEQSGAALIAVGIVIEKGFQEGGKLLREKGIPVESLAIIKTIHDGEIIFEYKER